MSRRHRIGRCLLYVAAGCLAVVLMLGAGAAVFLAQADLAPHLSRFAGTSIGREVTIGSLALGWRDGVTVDLRGLAVANATWSEMPQMIGLDEASAIIDAGALWRGVLRFERLRVRGLRLVLERGPDGVGNWAFGDGEAGGDAMPKDRSRFPTLLDAALRDSLITYRTSSGAILKIELDQVTIRTTDDDRPVAIDATGAYNDVAARVEGTAESFDALRDAARPYGVAFDIETETTTATYDGTLMRPLDFDGADGRLTVEATDTGDLARIFGAGIGVTFPVKISGHMTREGDDWRLADAEGNAAGNPFTGALRLMEGGRGEPDDVAADLDFAEFDAAPFLAGAEGDGDYLATPLSPVEAPGINIDADLRATTFIYGKTRLADVALTGRLAGRQITIEHLGFALADGKVTLSGSSQPAKSGAEVKMDAMLEAIDVAELAQSIGAAPGDVSGTLDGRATIAMTGTTLRDALGASSGHAVVAMGEGRIARAILEMASTDLRSLFRDKQGTARIRCALGILHLENGVGRVPLVKLRTTEATINGSGTVNLVAQRVDMTFMTAPDSTGFFALDMPFRVRGALSSPSVEPQLGGGPKPGEFPTAGSRGDGLPAALKRLAQRNACSG